MEDIDRILRRFGLSQDSVLRYEDVKLRRIIDHAVSRVPYYRALFEKNHLKPSDIRGVADIARVPLTSKKEIKKAPAGSCLSEDAKVSRLKTFKTTGSTGVPLFLKRTAAEDFLFHLFRMRAIRSYGLRSRDHVTRLRNDNLEYLPLSWRLARAAGLFRQSIISTQDTPQKNAADLLARRPDVLTGYNGAIARIARIIRGDLGATLPLKFVVGGADVLTPLFRRQIQEAFRARIYDTYECQELGLLAWECRESGLYHVCDDNLIIEVLKDGRPAGEGERGEVVATSLHLRAMPFIRYRLDDLVTVGPGACPCGGPYRTFKSIEAKRQDYFLLPGGRELYPWAVSLLLIDEAPWVVQFQLVQEKVDRVVMLAEASVPPGEGEIERLQGLIRPILGPEVEFAVKIVPEIEPTPGGKFWVRRSLVNTMYEGEPDT